MGPMTTTNAPAASHAMAREKNANLHACPTCGMTWALVIGAPRVNPGHHEPHPNQGGETVTRWVAAGASADTRRADDGTSPTYLECWSCTCGTAMSVSRTAMAVVPCSHGAPDNGVCAKRAERNAPDQYVNARYGGACPCCGHSGSHLVPRGQAPLCRTV